MGPQLDGSISLLKMLERERRSAGAAPVRICLVTSAFSGPTQSGGIGAAFTSLALHLAEAQEGGAKLFEVSVLYAAHPFYASGSPTTWIHQWRSRNIDFIPLVSTTTDFYGPRLVIRAYKIFEYLKERDGDFDVIVYHDYLGNGFFLSMAKHLQLAFLKTTLIVQLHSTSRWTDELNFRPPRDHNTLAYYHMEERSILWADVRVSPSKYYLEWHQARLLAAHPAKPSLVIQNCIHPIPPKPTWPRQITVEGLCFFGRLEHRKGLYSFLDAIELLLAQGKFPQRLAFLGPDTKVDGRSTQAYILARAEARGWPHAPDVVTDMSTEQALLYIRAYECVAVVPSLGDNSPQVIVELVTSGLPLAATSVGGVAELLDNITASLLTPPGNARALAARLVGALEQGMPAAALAVAPETTVASHLHLLQALTSSKMFHVEKASGAVRARMAVGISSFERPHSLVQAVDSLLQQDYPRDLMHLIVVDDASASLAMATTLTDITAKIKLAGISYQIIRIPSHQFVGRVRNVILREALQAHADFVCLMDDDDIALPNMLSEYASAAAATQADVLTDFSDNYNHDAATGARRFSHRSLSVGDAISHNFFINNYGKANFCIRPAKGLAMGGHHEDASPYVDWGFFTRASLAHLHMELVPLALYQYTVNSSRSILNGMASKWDRYRGHMKMLSDVHKVVPVELQDALTLCRYKLGWPRVDGNGN